MKKIMKQYKGKVMKTLMMLFAASFALAGTSVLSSCSSDDDPYFTASENDEPRILNTDLANSKIDRVTNYKLKIDVTPLHYTTITWLLDGNQIFEGREINQTLPVGTHELKIVATTTLGKSTSRTLTVTVTPLASDPAMGSSASELWVAPGETTEIHNGANLDKVAKVLINGKEVPFEVLDDGKTLKLTALTGVENGDYPVTLVDNEGNEFVGGSIKITTEPRPVLEDAIWVGDFSVTWGTPFDALKDKSIELIDNGKIKAGTILRVYVEGNGQGTAATSWWNDLFTGNPREDKMLSGSACWEFVLTDTSISLLKEQNGLLVVGDGYRVTKVTIE